MANDNYNASTRQMLANIVMGIRVDRPTSVLPQTDTTTYFTISVGKVLMTELIGEITTEAVGGAVELTIDHNPTTGTTAAIAALLDINPWDIGDVLTISGLLTGNVLPAVHAGSVDAMPYGGVILTPGALTFTTGASVAGYVKWSLFYIPLDDGAYVTAA
jgi:hypothetical protein